jgi:hypothetical protein
MVEGEHPLVEAGPRIVILGHDLVRRRPQGELVSRARDASEHGEHGGDPERDGD